MRQKTVLVDPFKVVAHTIATVLYSDTEVSSKWHLLLLVPLLPDFLSPAFRNDKVIAADCAEAGAGLINTISHISISP